MIFSKGNTAVIPAPAFAKVNCNRNPFSAIIRLIFQTQWKGN